VDDTSDELGGQLHSRLLAGDPTAQVLVAEQILPEVLLRLSSYRIARVSDDQLVADAITDAFLAYVKQPSSYDPDGLDLKGYLAFAAHRNLLTALKKASTRKKYEQSVEVARPERNDEWEQALLEREERETLLALIPGATLEEKLASILPDPQDQGTCLLMLSGERETEVFAKLLCLTGDVDTVRREVKRRKDRITRVLQRFKKNFTHGDIEE
jgi:DNA-directed RNA polymerase specialized sigma24 family protein